MAVMYSSLEGRDIKISLPDEFHSRNDGQPDSAGVARNLSSDFGKVGGSIGLRRDLLGCPGSVRHLSLSLRLFQMSWKPPADDLMA